MRPPGSLLLVSLTTILVLTAADGLGALAIHDDAALAMLQTPGALSVLASAGVALAATLQRRVNGRSWPR